MSSADVGECRAVHARAVASYIAAAQRFERDRWHEPLQPGKWSPAEVTQHLRLTFEATAQELAGGAPMRLRAGRLVRFIIRLTIMRRILAGGAFPTGVRAPREVRPVRDDADRDDALAALRDRSTAIETLCVAEFAQNPRTAVTHPYFGSVRVPRAMILSARHVDHHRGQLERALETQ
jgi:hypothetical protein